VSEHVRVGCGVGTDGCSSSIKLFELEERVSICLHNGGLVSTSGASGRGAGNSEADARSGSEGCE
jgi:hypothetical protein